MILTCIVIALAAATAAVTVARSRLFEWLREWTRDAGWMWVEVARSRRPSHSGEYRVRRTRWELLDALVHCPYCISHWIVLLGAAIYQPQLVHSGASLLDVLVTALAVIAAAAAAAAVLCRVYDFAGEQR